MIFQLIISLESSENNFSAIYISKEMIVASGKIWVEVMMELRQHVLNGRGMPDEWKTSVIVPIFKGKGDVMSCGSYRGVQLREHAMKIVERVLRR